MVKQVGQNHHQETLPPLIPRLLVSVFTPRDDLEAVMGDLAEEYHTRTLLQSNAKARTWYWHQSVASIPYWILSRKPGLATLATLLAGVASYSVVMCWEMWVAVVLDTP